MKRLVLIAALLSAFFVIPAAASDDITGIWTLTDLPRVKVLIERQENRLRVAVANANLVGQALPWYYGDVVDNGGTLTFNATAYTNPNIAVGSIPLKLSFSGPFSGVLNVGNVDRTIERRPLVTNGLLAPLDPEAPETGWYRQAGSNLLPLTFVEVQARSLLSFRLTQTTGVTSLVVQTWVKSAAKTWKLTGSNLLLTSPDQTSLHIGQTVATHVQLAPRTAFVEDVSASIPGPDTNNDGLRDDIDNALTQPIKRTRVKAAMAEIGRAYFSYLVSPSTTTAEAAAVRIATTATCLKVLVGMDRATEIPTLMKSLVFNTPARTQSYLTYLRQSAGVGSWSPAVSLANPNACASFMQGIIRRYDLLTPTQLKSLAAPGQQPREGRSQELRARFPHIYPTPRAVPTLRTCAGTKILHLSGVSTDDAGAQENKEHLKDFLVSNGVDHGFEYDAIANPNPGLIKNAIEYLIEEKGFSDGEAQSLIDSGFQLFRSGLKLIFTKPRGSGLLVGNVVITAGEIQALGGIIAKSALARNAQHAALVQAEVNTDLYNYYRVIMVPHSQGNQYANITYNALFSTQRQYASIASVANATPRVAVSSSIGANRDDDLVLNLARKIDPKVEKPTVINAGNPRDFFTRHKFIESYLDNAKAAAQVLKNVQKALKETKEPTTNRILGTTSGGYTGSQAQIDTFDIGRNGVTFKVEYQAYTIPDRFDVIYRGKRVASTNNLVSGGGTLIVKLPYDKSNPKDGLLVIAVYGPDPGTAWDYTVHCP